MRTAGAMVWDHLLILMRWRATRHVRRCKRRTDDLSHDIWRSLSSCANDQRKAPIAGGKTTHPAHRDGR